MPLSLNVFEGNKFEGHTMLPCINSLVQNFNLKDFVVVADSAMLSVENLGVLEKQGFKYIVGARIGNLPTNLFKELLEKAPKKDGETIRITIKPDSKRVLIVSYSAKRARKDQHDREKLLATSIKAQTNPSIITRRYKFLVAKSGKLELKKTLIEKSISLEGLKGYITNYTVLTDGEIIQKYGELWQVEKSFRMSKSDLLARPIFHTLKESIEAHLLVVFTALAISRYVEIISQKSIQKVVKTLLQVKEILIKEKITGQTSSRFTNPTEEVQKLLKLAHITWVT
jgi:transposase